MLGQGTHDTGQSATLVYRKYYRNLSVDLTAGHFGCISFIVVVVVMRYFFGFCAICTFIAQYFIHFRVMLR